MGTINNLELQLQLQHPLFSHPLGKVREEFVKTVCYYRYALLCKLIICKTLLNRKDGLELHYS
jgi:hypothetical protein